MADAPYTTLSNGLRVRRIPIEGTRAITALVGFEAGLASKKCVEAHRRIREIVSDLGTRGPDPDHLDRARSYAAGRRVLAFENTDRVADHAAEAQILFDEREDPDSAVGALGAISYEDAAAVAAGLDDEPAVACVGPHTSADFG